VAWVSNVPLELAPVNRRFTGAVVASPHNDPNYALA
jgi:hypothetical protein